MGNCNCCCSCSCGGSGGQGGHAQPGQPGGFGGFRPNPGTGRCMKYEVTFVSIDVHKLDDGIFDKTLEAEFTFSVNHETKTWKKDLKKGKTTINKTIYADVPSNQSNLMIQVSGKEKDPVFDDKLAGFELSFGANENWGMGSQSEGASNSSINYTMNYKIGCASQRIATVPAGAMTGVAHMQEAKRAEAEARSNKEQLRQQLEMLKAHGVETKEGSDSKKFKSSRPPLSQAQLFSRSLDRFSREGWECIHISDDQVVFKGYGDFPDIVNNWYEQDMNQPKGKKG